MCYFLTYTTILEFTVLFFSLALHYYLKQIKPDLLTITDTFMAIFGFDTLIQTILFVVGNCNSEIHENRIHPQVFIVVRLVANALYLAFRLL